MYLSPEQQDELRPFFKILRIICGALIGGLLVASILISTVIDWQNVTTALDILPIFGLGFMVLCSALAFIVPSFIGPSALEPGNVFANKIDNQQIRSLFAQYQTRTIIKFSLLDGAAFLNLMLFMIEHSLFNLAAVAFTVVIMLVSIPSDNAVIQWIETRMGQDELKP